jgi:DNA repair exonuclease SbcCD ATPase subunit
MEKEILEKPKKGKKKKEPVVIPSKAQIKVYWDDFPENNSYEGKKRVKTYFSEKYNIPQENINVVFRAKKRDTEGKEVSIEEGVIDNIMDINYQRDLFKQWLDREKIEVDLDRLIKLDDKVNEILKTKKDTDYRYRRWFIKNIEINNFLSFGDDNLVDYNKLNGVNLVTSNPTNTGGKTNFCVDALLFLFFGTTTKTSKNEEIFNTFSDKNKVLVKGLVNIDGQDYMIERSLSRKLKKDDTWGITTGLEYHKVLPDGTYEDLKGEARQQTEKIIVESIGSDSDFLTTIIATGENIENLIHTKPTERGKIFTKFIGLEVIEDKETIVKELSSDFRKKMKGLQYDIETLKSEIVDLENEIKESNDDITQKNVDLIRVNNEVLELDHKKNVLVSKKQEVDPKILRLNENTIKNEIAEITKKGKLIRVEVDNLKDTLETIPELEFDEDEYDGLLKEDKDLVAEKTTISLELKNKNNLIKQLEEGEICPMCKRELDDVDHTDEINEIKKEIEGQTKLLNEVVSRITQIGEDIRLKKELKTKVDERQKLELLISKKEVEMDRMRLELKEKANTLQEYENNKMIIENNQKLQSEIILLESNIKIKNNDRDNVIIAIESAKNTIKNASKGITEKNQLIEQIKKEEEIDKIFTIYEKMIGKNGISKMVIKSVIPILNSEIEQLLDGISDFNIELRIGDKNEIEFLLIRGDVIKNLSTGSGFEKTVGSLALRTILGRISTLPKPNIIVFDEVLGKVSDDNLPALKMFFDKIRAYFDIILLITHREHFKELANQQIMINKENNISKFRLV